MRYYQEQMIIFSKTYIIYFREFGYEKKNFAKSQSAFSISM